MLATDKRLELLAELFSGIRILKSFCWENYFKKAVDKLRRYEK